jgi:cytoskeletal protein RodZ
MPYIIAVLLFVVIGAGYALLGKSEQSIEVSSDTVTSNDVAVIESSSTPVTLAESDQTKSENTTKSNESNNTVTAPAKPAETPTQNQTPTPVTPTPAPADTNTYKNGTYRTQSSYRTPDGTYQMDVSLTISNDKITASTLSFDADGSRDGYSKRFSSSYQSQIVGKSLEGLSVSRVGGASLTTRAFNTALSSIRSQAS